MRKIVVRMSDAVLYDKDIREPLFDFLEESYGRIRILEEMPIGKASTIRDFRRDSKIREKQQKYG